MRNVLLCLALIRETVMGIRRVRGTRDGFVECLHNTTLLAQVRSDNGSDNVNCLLGLFFRPLVFLPCASVHSCGAGDRGEFACLPILLEFDESSGRANEAVEDEWRCCDGYLTSFSLVPDKSIVHDVYARHLPPFACVLSLL